jgi:uncharacterized protein
MRIDNTQLCYVQTLILDFTFLLCYNACVVTKIETPGGANLNERSPLRLNVGFLLNKNVGYSRNFEFEIPHTVVDGDLEVKNLTGTLHATRTGQGVYMHGSLTAAALIECVRCLDEFDQILTAELDELFVYPPQKDVEPELTISEEAILDLNPILRELFILDIPIQPVCRTDCQGLCPVCGENRNEQQCEHPEEKIDPRMAVLKSLLD